MEFQEHNLIFFQMGVGWFNRQLYRCSYLFIHLFIYSFSFFWGGRFSVWFPFLASSEG